MVSRRVPFLSPISLQQLALAGHMVLYVHLLLFPDSRRTVAKLIHLLTPLKLTPENNRVEQLITIIAHGERLLR